MTIFGRVFDFFTTYARNFRILTMSHPISRKLHFTYHVIACCVRGNPINADKGLINFALKIREYLLDVLNEDNHSAFMSNAVYASQAFLFYGHSLAWNAAKWEKSADIVYRYYKAKTLIDKILEYNVVAGKQIVEDYIALLHYLSRELENGNNVNFYAGPGLNDGFSYVPETVLLGVIKDFESQYE